MKSIHAEYAPGCQRRIRRKVVSNQGKAFWSLLQPSDNAFLSLVLSKWGKLIDGGKRFLLSSLWRECYIEKLPSQHRIALLFISLAQELVLFSNSCSLPLLFFFLLVLKLFYTSSVCLHYLVSKWLCK